MFYKHYQNTKPVATDSKVETVNKVENKTNYKNIINQVGNNKSSDNGYLYLFESKINPINNKKREFEDGDQFQNNLMNLIQSGHPEDINQAAAIWKKNKENYAFTNNKNLITSGIGHDIFIYNKYFELVNGMKINAIGSFQSNMGKSVATRFQTPMTMAIIGAQLMPQGQLQFLTDNNSNILEYYSTGVIYKGMTQYKSESDIEKSKQADKLKEIFNKYKNINSVYEVNLSNLYNRESTGYIIEDNNGNLSVYGFYYSSPMTNDSTLLDYKKQVEEYGEYDGATEDDITWDNFVNATK